MSFSKKAYYHHPKWNSPIHHSLLQSLFFITLEKCNYFASFFFLVISPHQNLLTTVLLSIWKSSKCSVNSHSKWTHACTHAKSLQSCLTLCNPIDCSRSGSSVHGILQARILQWVAMPYSKDLPYLRIEPASFLSLLLAGGFFTTSATWEALVSE